MEAGSPSIPSVRQRLHLTFPRDTNSLDSFTSYIGSLNSSRGSLVYSLDSTKGPRSQAEITIRRPEAHNGDTLIALTTRRSEIDVFLLDDDVARKKHHERASSSLFLPFLPRTHGAARMHVSPWRTSAVSCMYTSEYARSRVRMG